MQPLPSAPFGSQCRATSFHPASAFPQAPISASASRMLGPSTVVPPRGKAYVADCASVSREQAWFMRAVTSAKSRGNCLAIQMEASTEVTAALLVMAARAPPPAEA